MIAMGSAMGPLALLLRVTVHGFVLANYEKIKTSISSAIDNLGLKETFDKLTCRKNRDGNKVSAEEERMEEPIQLAN